MTWMMDGLVHLSPTDSTIYLSPTASKESLSGREILNDGLGLSLNHNVDGSEATAVGKLPEGATGGSAVQAPDEQRFLGSGARPKMFSSNQVFSLTPRDKYIQEVDKMVTHLNDVLDKLKEDRPNLGDSYRKQSLLEDSRGPDPVRRYQDGKTECPILERTDSLSLSGDKMPNMVSTFPRNNIIDSTVGVNAVGMERGSVIHGGSYADHLMSTAIVDNGEVSNVGESHWKSLPARVHNSHGDLTGNHWDPNLVSTSSGDVKQVIFSAPYMGSASYGGARQESCVTPMVPGPPASINTSAIGGIKALRKKLKDPKLFDGSFGKWVDYVKYWHRLVQWN
jgi:hypothetical protein